MNLTEEVKEYVEKRGYKNPSFAEAMMFVETEIAEVYELVLSKIGGWIRNNPGNKPEFSKQQLAEELGDAIMMLIVAGISEDIDPIEALREKMKRKLSEAKMPADGFTLLIGEAQREEWEKIFGEPDEK